MIPRDRVCRRSTKIAVEGKIFAFGFLKKYDLSLLSIEGRVLDQCRSFDRLVSVYAHLFQEDENLQRDEDKGQRQQEEAAKKDRLIVQSAGGRRDQLISDVSNSVRSHKKAQMFS